MRKIVLASRRVWGLGGVLRRVWTPECPHGATGTPGGVPGSKPASRGAIGEVARERRSSLRPFLGCLSAGRVWCANGLSRCGRRAGRGSRAVAPHGASDRQNMGGVQGRWIRAGWAAAVVGAAMACGGCSTAPVAADHPANVAQPKVPYMTWQWTQWHDDLVVSPPAYQPVLTK